MPMNCRSQIVVTAASAPELKMLLKTARTRERLTYKGAAFFRVSLQGREILLVKTGIGPKKAFHAARHLLDMGTPAMVIAAGAAGALDPALRIADIVVPRNIISLTGPPCACHVETSQKACAAAAQAGLSVSRGDCLSTNHFVNLRAAKAALFSRTRAQIVDMESAALASALSHAGVPLISVRAVSDVACEDAVDMARIMACKKAAGLPGVLLHLLKNSRELLRAIRLMRDVSRACTAAARTVSCLVQELA